MNSPRERIVAEIRAELARQRLTRLDLANSTGMATSTLSRRMTCKDPFTVDELHAVAHFLGITVTELIARAEPEEAAS